MVKIDSLYSLYTLIKEISQQKGLKVKVVCDWNDVIQDAVSYPLWDIGEKTLTYETYFQNFWSEYQGDLYWRKDEKLNNLVNMYWNDPGYFDKVAFLSPAKELLLTLKENLIEELIFLSSYSERVHPGGDTRKLKKFQATFGQFSQVKGLELIASRGDSKGEWLSENYPNFDIFIDDSPKKILSVKDVFPNRIYALPHYTNRIYALPHYKCNERVQGENVYHVKTSVSDLRVENIVQVAQEQVSQQHLEINIEVPPKPLH